jgi:DNA modification methylase
MPRQEVEVGDAFDMLPELADNSAHAAIIDYPWEFEIQNGTGRFEFRNAPRGADEGCRDLDHEDIMFDMAPDERFVEVLSELSRILVNGAWVFCMADDRFQEVVRESLRESDFTFRRNWAWTPKNMGMGYYGRVNHYPIPAATNGETERYVQDRGTLIEVPGGREVDYPTGKPAELYRELLSQPVIFEGERLLEPFCGSGPGAEVAVSRELDYWACDVDVDAVELTSERLEQTGLGNWTQGEII